MSPQLRVSLQIFVYMCVFLTPAQPPARIIQRAQGMRWQDGLDWVGQAGLGGDAPQALQGHKGLR